MMKLTRNLLATGLLSACLAISASGQPRLICAVCDSSGTIATRLQPPAGFERLKTERGTLTGWLRDLPLLPEGANAVDWRGYRALSAKEVATVLDWRLLGQVEQCADVAVRLFAEYARGNGAQDRIAFRSLSGQTISWKHWLEGRYTVNENATAVVYQGGESRPDTPREFDAYLRFVMSYVSTVSLARDWAKVPLEDIRPGDILIQPGVPGSGLGHMSVVVDACEDLPGQRLYLFIDGFTPARLPVVRERVPGDPSSAWMTPQEYEELMIQFGSGNFHRGPDWVATAAP